MVADALVLATKWVECRSFDRRVIRNAMRDTLVIHGHSALDGALLFTLEFAYAGIDRMSTASAHVNDFLDLPGTVEAHTVAD
jgi:hypothetical protein